MSEMNKAEYTAIGKRLKGRREQLHLTQADLARRVGVSASFIGHIERAEKVPSLETMARLGEALGVTLDWLVFGVNRRCEGKRCPLYVELAALLRAYGIGVGE